MVDALGNRLENGCFGFDHLELYIGGSILFTVGLCFIVPWCHNYFYEHPYLARPSFPQVYALCFVDYTQSNVNGESLTTSGGG
jgi:hypothetical protein